MAELSDLSTEKKRVKIRGVRMNDATREMIIELSMNPSGEEVDAVLSISQFMNFMVLSMKLGMQFTEEELRWGDGDGETNGYSNGEV